MLTIPMLNDNVSHFLQCANLNYELKLHIDKLRRFHTYINQASEFET